MLIVIYTMALKQKKPLKYEDMYVKAFKKYPIDLQLRGYPDYPDTEIMSKKIYALRQNGLIQVNRKLITITEKGKTLAEKLIKLGTSNHDKNIPIKTLSRDITNQLERIKNTEAFHLFVTDNKEQIVDTDFFDYLGTTVRTERTDFKGRIKTVQDVIKTIEKSSVNKTIVDLHNFLFDKFKDIIKIKLSIGYPRR